MCNANVNALLTISNNTVSISNNWNQPTITLQTMPQLLFLLNTHSIRVPFMMLQKPKILKLQIIKKRNFQTWLFLTHFFHQITLNSSTTRVAFAAVSLHVSSHGSPYFGPSSFTSSSNSFLLLPQTSKPNLVTAHLCPRFSNKNSPTSKCKRLFILTTRRLTS